MVLKNRAFFLLLVLVAFIGLAAPARRVDARASVSISFFYDELAPYGEWVTVADFGRCWRPARVRADWQPYLDGEWIYTDDGWTWVSFDAWGGDPYHYGTWTFANGYGWVWIPGTIWAPAWVTWYISDSYCGWAPVPPSLSVGISGYVGPAVTVSRTAYVFVPTAQFAAVNATSARVPVAQNAVLMAKARPVTRFAVSGGVLTTGGPSVAQVERVTGRKIQRASLVRAKTQAAPLSAALRGSRARVVAPAPERARFLAVQKEKGASHAGTSRVSSEKPRVAPAVRTGRSERALPAHTSRGQEHVMAPPKHLRMREPARAKPEPPSRSRNEVVRHPGSVAPRANNPELQAKKPKRLQEAPQPAELTGSRRVTHPEGGPPKHEGGPRGHVERAPGEAHAAAPGPHGNAPPTEKPPKQKERGNEG